jgi:hypothetical protein
LIEMLHFILIALTWLVGVGGVGGAVAAVAATVYLGPAAAMALASRFFACTRCVVAVAVLVSVVGAYWVGRAGEYERGYKRALAAIAEQDAGAIASATELRSVWRDCRARGGAWDQSNGSCQ